MSPAPEWDHRGQPPEGDAHVRQQLASIGGSLFNGIPVDERFESGVPEDQRGNSLAFIQMTGLTRPSLRPVTHEAERALSQVPLYDDLNATGAPSFYEKGVSDVDDGVGLDSLLGRLGDVTLDIDLVPGQHAEPLVTEGVASRSAQAFRDIVAGLQRGELASGPAPEEAPETAADGLDAEAPKSPDEPQPYGESASGALLALVQELESVMGVSAEPSAATPDGEDTHLEGLYSGAPAGKDSGTVGDSPGERVQDNKRPFGSSPVARDETPPLSVPAAEIDDNSFDALLSSLAGASSAVDEAPVAEDAVVVPEAGVADEWDALLDTISVKGLESATPAPVSAPVREPMPERPSVPPSQLKLQSSSALAEAEQLMQALEKKPKAAPGIAVPVPAPVSPALLAPAAEVTAPVELAAAGWAVPTSAPAPFQLRFPERAPSSSEEENGEPQSGYDYSAPPSRRRSRRHSRVARRSRKIIKVVFYVLLLGALASTLWFFVAIPMLLKDEDLSERAERLMKSQDFVTASQTYLQLASRIAPGEPDRSNAEFRAAYALTLGPEHSDDETKSRYGTAVALFKKFTEDYPQHPKRARALSIMGRLYFELRDFEKAIEVLRDQVKPADDPAAALSILRYLARAYSMTGNYEQAETSYLQAATLPGNYNAEADYLELGKMYRTRASVAREPVDQEPLKSKAMQYWQLALKVPGLAPGDRNVLEEQLKWAAFTEQSGASPPGAMAPADAASPAMSVPGAVTSGGEAVPASASAPSAEDDPAPVVSPIPVATDEAGRAEVPGAELEALVPTAHPAAE